MPIFGLALLAGLALHAGIGLQPAWWWTWITPVPVLWLALAIRRAGLAHAAVALASVVAATAYSRYFALVMPVPATVLATAGVALMWWAVLMSTRRIAHRIDTAWSVLAYPCAWVALDLLRATFLPDGDWGSLAYTQADVLPLLQVSALGGVPLLLFLLCLPASVLALLSWRRGRLRGAGWAVGATALSLLAAFGYGQHRLAAPAVGAPLRVGLASIDDAIGTQASVAYASNIRDRYDALVAELATAGARLVVLPEKIAVLAPAVADEWNAHFGALARTHDLWLEVGIGIDDGVHPRNHAWLFGPDGERTDDYQKHFMAPPERAQSYAAGDTYHLRDIAGRRIGMAICKDMHFSRFGRMNGELGAAAMLVPAWDFAYRDAWLAERMTATRGVEGGYTVIRASREGLLSVSDARGRRLAEVPSAPMPGRGLLVDVPLGPREATLYSRIGDAFGWSCVVAAVLLRLAAQRRRGRGRQGFTAHAH